MNNSFDSIDRLVEFGLGIGVARQMIRTMDLAIGNMPVAGAGNAFASPVPVQFYAVVDGLQAGPLTEKEVSELVRNKRIGRDTLMWKPGFTAWKTAENIPEINKLILLNS